MRTLPMWSTLRLVAAAGLVATGAHAQEFTRQTLLVAPFHSTGAAKVARQIADGVRSRIARLGNRRELFVLDGDTTEFLLERGGFNWDAVLNDTATYVLARRLRADEVVLGKVLVTRNAVEVHGELALTRDWRQRQPLPVVRAASPAAAADTLARAVIAARAQMPGLRRCENRVRVGDNIVAAREAERAVQAFPSSTFARICLAMALHYNEVSVDSLQRVVDDVLSLDSLNIIAAVMRATILEADRRPNDAALAWARVAALRGDSLELAVTAVENLVRLDHPALAATIVTTLIKGHPAEPRLRRFLFRVDVSLQRWQAAAALGDSLEAEDAEFRADSSYAIRHVEALRMIGDTLSALAKSARAVKLHPGDGRLYLQYVQLVGNENGVMLDRGIKLFPDLPELRVLAARVARAAGNKGAELAALRDAVRNDPSMAQGFLRIAEIWFQENHVDSALAALRKAPRDGPSTELLRTYVEGRGMQLVRAASDTMPESFHAAIGFFVLADSVDSRDDSRSLIVASMLQLAQSELAVAAKARSCPGMRRADEALIRSAAMLARGVGTGSAADELRDAQVKLRAAVGNASKVLCG